MNTAIVYSTKYGCTEKCAIFLKDKLSGSIDLYNLKSNINIDISTYNKIIIGGSIYAGKIRREVSEFCSANNELLKQKKIGLFICGMLHENAETEINSSYSEDLLNSAIVKEFFGGEFRFDKMKSLDKFLVKLVSKDKNQSQIDTSNDISTISEDIINNFAHTMNNA